MNSKTNLVNNNQNKNQATKKTTSPYTEDWINVKGIKDGVILLPNRDMVTGVKIYPRNIFILDPIQQESVLNAMRNFYNLMNFEFWLIVADRPVDISIYMSQLQLLYNKTTSPSIRKLIMQDIEKGNSFINNNVVDTEYYILFKDKKDEDVQKKVRLLINGLAGCGLNASQASNDDLRVIINNFLNGGMDTKFGTVMPL